MAPGKKPALDVEPRPENLRSILWPLTIHGAKGQLPPNDRPLGVTGWQKRATRVSLISRDGQILWPTLPGVRVFGPTATTLRSERTSGPRPELQEYGALLPGRFFV